MKPKSYKKLATAAAILLTTAGTALWLMEVGSLSVGKATFWLRQAPLATVGGQSITMNDFTKRFNESRPIAAEQGIADVDLRRQVYDRLVFETQVRLVANKYLLSASADDVDAEYRYFLSGTAQNGSSSPAAILIHYGLSENDLKTDVIMPEALLARLQSWYNSQPQLAVAAYKKLEQVKNDLAGGSSFSLAAVQYSDDARTAAMGGDAGFVAVDALLPELTRQAGAARLGEANLWTSRLGLHYAIVEQRQDSQDGNVAALRIRQIFIKSDGFGRWFAGETKTFPVRQIGQY